MKKTDALFSEEEPEEEPGRGQIKHNRNDVAIQGDYSIGGMMIKDTIRVVYSYSRGRRSPDGCTSYPELTRDQWQL